MGSGEGLVGDCGGKIGFDGVGCWLGEIGSGGEELDTERGTTRPEFEEMEEMDS